MSFRPVEQRQSEAKATIMTDILEFLAQVWREQPSLIVFLGLGLIVFLCLVIDSHRLHRQRTIRQRTGLY